MHDPVTAQQTQQPQLDMKLMREVSNSQNIEKAAIPSSSTKRREDYPYCTPSSMTTRTAFTMTIHEIKDNVGCLPFNHDQLCVALTGITDPTNQYTFIPRSDSSPPPSATNVTYRKVLL